MPVVVPSRGMRVYATVALFTALAGDAIRNSISWLGWGIVVAVLMLIGVGLLVRHRRSIRPQSVPYPLLAFGVLALASIAWSQFPAWTAVGVVAQWGTAAVAGSLALLFGWRAFLGVLSAALKWVLGLSLLFEFVVAVFVRHPVYPFFTDWEVGEVPITYAWSRGLLFEGGPIQGIVHNASTLAFLALLTLIVVVVQWFGDAERLLDPDDPMPKRTTARRHAVTSLLWVAVAVVTMVLGQSELVFAALLVVGLTVVAVVVVHRTPRGAPRVALGAVAVVVGSGAVVSAIVFRDALIGFFERSGLLTGRLDIWRTVLGMVDEHPVGGWGWLGYWVPWIEPFDGLVVTNKTLQLHAHNAWFDVAFQLGAVGVVVFAALVLSVLARSWFIALDGQDAPDSGARVLSFLPLLLMVALVVQTAGESRILIEYGWLLLVYLAFATRMPAAGPHGPVRWLPVAGARSL